jgi:hypothetical protein
MKQKKLFHSCNCARLLFFATKLLCELVCVVDVYLLACTFREGSLMQLWTWQQYAPLLRTCLYAFAPLRLCLHLHVPLHFRPPTPLPTPTRASTPSPPYTSAYTYTCLYTFAPLRLCLHLHVPLHLRQHLPLRLCLHLHVPLHLHLHRCVSVALNEENELWQTSKDHVLWLWSSCCDVLCAWFM